MSMIKGYASTTLGQIHYRRAGNGEPVVLLCQSGRSSQMHHDLMLALASDFDVIAPDLPGTGQSAPLVPGTSFEAIAGSFLEVVDAIVAKPVCLYGIHTGNKVGTAMAALSPGSVRRFVFAGQSHSIIPDQATRNDVIRKAVSGIETASDNANRRVLKTWAQKIAEISSVGLSPSALSEVIDGGSFDKTLDWLIDDLQAMRSRPDLYQANFSYDLERDLRKLAIETLILEIATPYEDRTIGRQGERVLALVPKGRLLTLEQADGHGITLEAAYKEIATTLRDFFK